MTYLEAINEVLVLLREDTITALDETEYATLIGLFVNKAKNKIEGKHDWFWLQSDITVTTAASTSTYALTGAGRNSRVVKTKHEYAFGYDVFNNTEDVFMKKAPSLAWLNYQLNYSSPDNNEPTYWHLDGYDGSYDPQVKMYPIPDGVYSINFRVYTPQAELTSASTEIIIPGDPIVYEAYRMALRERGEDGGQMYIEAVQEAKDFLNIAMENDEAYELENTLWNVE